MIKGFPYSIQYLLPCYKHNLESTAHYWRLIKVNIQCSTLANSVDLDEMMHNEAFYLGLPSLTMYELIICFKTKTVFN